MKVSMDDSRLNNLNELRAFLTSAKRLVLQSNTINSKYRFINRTLRRFNYRKLKRKDKHAVLLYIKKVTGYKKAQALRLVKRSLAGGLARTVYQRHNPHVIYTPADVKMLEITDALHRRLNSLATKEILRREAELFNRKEYRQIAQVSPAHINNLRHSPVYRRLWINSTKSRQIPIGHTREPEANNRPGSLRVDTVHQRDVYHINAVCKVTQWEIVSCMPLISERYLEPALTRMLAQFPFGIFNFHSDRGSEFINKVVAKLLNKLLIEQTKSRSRHSNDNALVESKNGWVVRKNMGYTHINFNAAEMISQFYQDWFNPYLNYHRPCLYVTEIRRDEKGREIKIYGQAATPYEKLKETGRLLNQNFLKPGLDFDRLDKIAYAESDNLFAAKMRLKEKRLFSKISQMKGL